MQHENVKSISMFANPSSSSLQPSGPVSRPLLSALCPLEKTTDAISQE